MIALTGADIRTYLFVNQSGVAAVHEDDLRYYRHRAETETERAEKATVPQAVRVHYQLAEAYFSKIASGESAQIEAL
jgi:hypothetical protein